MTDPQNSESTARILHNEGGQGVMKIILRLFPKKLLFGVNPLVPGVH